VADMTTHPEVPPREEVPTLAAVLKITLQPTRRTWLFRLAAGLRARTPARQVRSARKRLLGQEHSARPVMIARTRPWRQQGTYSANTARATKTASIDHTAAVIIRTRTPRNAITCWLTAAPVAHQFTKCSQLLPARLYRQPRKG
jgi:hypothetical protein